MKTFVRLAVLIPFLCCCIPASAQQYGTDNILNFYTVEMPIYIPYGSKVIYQDFDTRMEIDVDSASFTSYDDLVPAAFALDKNGIYYKGVLIDSDTVGFRYLTDRHHPDGISDIWKNRNHVYAGNSILKDIDAATCVVVVNDILRDKNGQYENFVKISDIQKNKKLLEEYPKGYDGHSFSNGNLLFNLIASFHIFDQESLEILSPNYVKDKNGVYFIDWYTEVKAPKRIKDAHKASFKDASNAGGYLAYDELNVYIGDKRLHRISGRNLQVLGVYMGYRLMSEFDRTPTYNYFLIKNDDGYWMVSEQNILPLGTDYPKHIINRSQKGKRMLFYE